MMSKLMMHLSWMVSKVQKEDDMIKALSEMTPEVRRYIAEVTYAPSKTNKAELNCLRRMDFK